MGVYAGTSGFSYPEWRGAFYPERLPAREMLAFYAERLPAVEINLTFYRRPGRALLEGWRAAVPAPFRFVFKAPRRLTHVRRLRDPGEELVGFLGPLALLGPQLGGVLFQLPPDMRCDAARLAAFLEALPEGLRAAFEFRHPSWWDESVFAQLRERNLAWCTADGDPDLPGEPVRTASWWYARLRRGAYPDPELEAWAARLRDAEAGFVFFKHEEGATGPALAARLMALAQVQWPPSMQ